MPLSKQGRSRCRRSRAHKTGKCIGRKTKQIELLETLRITEARTNTNYENRAEILNTTKVRIKNNTTTMISVLAYRNKLHGQIRNIRNIGNIK